MLGRGERRGRTVRDHDARPAGYRLLGNGVRQVIREQDLGLRRFLAGDLDVVKKEAHVIPRPVGKLNGEAGT